MMEWLEWDGGTWGWGDDGVVGMVGICWNGMMGNGKWMEIEV